MDKRIRLKMSVALGLGLLPAVFGLVGCSEQGTLPPMKETGARARDARQKASEYATVGEKAAPAKGRGH